jgi:hypothetical protein
MLRLQKNFAFKYDFNIYKLNRAALRIQKAFARRNQRIRVSMITTATQDATLDFKIADDQLQ